MLLDLRLSRNMRHACLGNSKQQNALSLLLPLLHLAMLAWVNGQGELLPMITSAETLQVGGRTPFNPGQPYAPPVANNPGDSYVEQQECQELQRIGLNLFFTSTGGPGWTTKDGWLQYPGNCIVRTSVFQFKLPDHCCWEGVSCCATNSCGVFGLGLVTRLSVPFHGLRGPFPIAALTMLTCGTDFGVLDLQSNYLTGSLPPEISTLSQLKTLRLGLNLLQGSLPLSMSALALRSLDLTANTPGFHGPLPPGLCGTTMADLSLSHNNFDGPLEVQNCTSLSFLDARSNQLSGSMPAPLGEKVNMLLLGDNQFSGAIPSLRLRAGQLSVLDAPANKLSGTIPRQMSELTFLTTLDMKENDLQGSIPAEIFQGMGLLRSIVLSTNSLTGTISDFVANARELTLIDLADNYLHGTIPETMASFAQQRATVSFQHNYLTCCGRGFVGKPGGPPLYESFDYDARRLPSFLKFALFLAPVTEKNAKLNNMRCPKLMQVDSDLNANGLILDWQIDPEYYMYEGCICEVGFHLQDMEPNEGAWYGNIPTKICVENSVSFFDEYPWLIPVVIVVVTLAALAFFVWFTCIRPGATRPAFVQTWINMKKRLRGEPTGGSISLVVTDIEGFSNLMKDSPELMTTALNVHNNILRKVRWNNFGYTAEQEGDSFALVFYDAVDAVMFCIQSQLQLVNQKWPEGLFKDEEEARAKAMLDSESLRRSVGASQFLNSILNLPKKVGKNLPASLGASTSHADNKKSFLRTVKGFNLGPSATAASSMCATTLGPTTATGGASLMHSSRASNSPRGASLMHPPSRAFTSPDILGPSTAAAPSLHGSLVRPFTTAAPSLGAPVLDPSTKAGGDPSRACLVSTSPEPSPEPWPASLLTKRSENQRSIRSETQRSIHSTDGDLHVRANPDDLIGPDARAAMAMISSMGRASGDEHPSDYSAQNTPLQDGMMPSPFNTSALQVGTRTESESARKASSNSVKAPKAPPPLLFDGLRVRMGVATGILPKGSMIRGSKVMEKCKVVSDAGAGGQITLDAETFHALEGRLVELGAVDADGLNYDILRTAPQSSPWYQFKFWRDARKDALHQAPVMDMGMHVCSPYKPLPSIFSVGTPHEKVVLTTSKSFSAKANPPKHSDKVGLARLGSFSALKALGMTKFAKKDKEGATAEDTLRLYQVLSPKLIERARVFENTLALKDGYQEAVPPYFKAPGTMQAPLDLKNEHHYSHYGSMPHVTMVHMEVEGGSTFNILHSRDGKLIHELGGEVIYNLLRQIPGGYLFKLDATRLEYALAFPNVSSAITFCAMAQECLMLIAWPDSAILQWSDETDSKTGNCLFRGPRYKMGMYEGAPKAIIPNDSGRPEYYGDLVQHSYNLMKNGAYGGQVVCEEALALKALEQFTQFKITSDHTRGCYASLPVVTEEDSEEAAQEAVMPVDLGSIEVEELEDLEHSRSVASSLAPSLLPPHAMLRSKLPFPTSALLDDSLDDGGGTAKASSVAPASARAYVTAFPGSPSIGMYSDFAVVDAATAAEPLELKNATCQARVVALSLGTHTVKGFPGTVKLVSVFLDDLEGRKFTKGKPKRRKKAVSGSTVEETLYSTQLNLPDTLQSYRHAWYGDEDGEGGQRTSSLIDGRGGGMHALANQLMRSMSSKNRRSARFADLDKDSPLGSHADGESDSSLMKGSFTSFMKSTSSRSLKKTISKSGSGREIRKTLPKSGSGRDSSNQAGSGRWNPAAATPMKSALASSGSGRMTGIPKHQSARFPETVAEGEESPAPSLSSTGASQGGKSEGKCEAVEEDNTCLGGAASKSSSPSPNKPKPSRLRFRSVNSDEEDKSGPTKVSSPRDSNASVSHGSAPGAIASHIASPTGSPTASKSKPSRLRFQVDHGSG